MRRDLVEKFAFVHAALRQHGEMPGAIRRAEARLLDHAGPMAARHADCCQRKARMAVIDNALAAAGRGDEQRNARRFGRRAAEHGPAVRHAARERRNDDNRAKAGQKLF